MGIKRVENDAYEIKHLKVDVEVGDRKTPGFKPKLKLKRWDEECSLDIDFAEETTEEELEEKLDGEGNIIKIKWKIKTATSELELEYYPVEPRIEILIVNGKEHKFLQNEEGGLEFGIVLKKKPSVNTFIIPIQIKGLRFIYQPPLHPDHPTWVNGNNPDDPDESKATAFRPENVVGSYAVYHESKKNNKYKTGKAFHIYRPKLIDSIMAEAWADMSISDGKLVITLPQDFLNTATYPVMLDPIFGYNVIGGATIKIADAGNGARAGSAWTMPVGGGTANWIKAYVNSLCAEDADCKVFINQKDSGGAGTHGQIATKENLNCSNVTHWEQFNLASEALTGGVVYILNIVANPADMFMCPFNVAYDDAPPPITAVASYYEDPHSYAAPENPWVVNPEDPTIDYSIYCDYDAAPPPPPAVAVKPLSLNLKARPKGGTGRPRPSTGGTSFGG